MRTRSMPQPGASRGRPGAWASTSSTERSRHNDSDLVVPRSGDGSKMTGRWSLGPPDDQESKDESNAEKDRKEEERGTLGLRQAEVPHGGRSRRSREEARLRQVRRERRHRGAA